MAERRERVTASLGRRTVPDPLARPDDPFADFREIELLAVEQRVDIRHSLGKTSRFFLALEEGTLLATRCERCGAVWLPPRPVCPDDLSVARWTELSGEGTLVSWTSCPRAPRYAATGEPYLLAYAAMAGASTLLLHQLRNADPGELRHGLPLRVVFGEGKVRHPLELFWLEPA